MDATNPSITSVKSVAIISEDTNGNNPLVWVNLRNDTLSSGDNAYYGIGPGRLLVLDQNLNLLWASNSPSGGSNELPGYAKFNPPIIANGRVYQAAFRSDDRLYAPGTYCQGSCAPCTTSPTYPFPVPQSGPVSCGSLTGSIEVYGQSPLTPPAIRAHKDFDKDGKDDLLWRDTTNGPVAIWLRERPVREAAS